MGYSGKKKKQEGVEFEQSNTLCSPEFLVFPSLLETPQNFVSTPLGDFKA